MRGEIEGRWRGVEDTKVQRINNISIWAYCNKLYWRLNLQVSAVVGRKTRTAKAVVLACSRALLWVGRNSLDYSANTYLDELAMVHPARCSDAWTLLNGARVLSISMGNYEWQWWETGLFGEEVQCLLTGFILLPIEAPWWPIQTSFEVSSGGEGEGGRRWRIWLTNWSGKGWKDIAGKRRPARESQVMCAMNYKWLREHHSATHKHWTEMRSFICGEWPFLLSYLKYTW